MKNVIRMLMTLVVWALVSGLQGEFWGMFTWLTLDASMVMAWIVTVILGIGAIAFVADNWE